MAHAAVPASAALALQSALDGGITEIGDGLTVGREAECGLCIAQGVISRLHARFAFRDGGCWVEDTGSTNGTFVNGSRIQAATLLKAGDRLAFDTIGYQVIASPAAAAADRDRTVVSGQKLPVFPAAVSEVTAPPAESAALAATPADAPAELASPSAPARPTPAVPEPTAAPPPRPTPAPKPVAAEAAAPTPAANAPAAPTAAPKPMFPQPTPAPPSRAGPSEGIPASWAEVGQLEKASHTMMMPAQLLQALTQTRVSTHSVIAAVRAETGRVRPVLIGLTHGFAGQVFALDVSPERSKWEIGRNSDADININDNSISGRHAQIVAERGRWKLVNLMSINGSFVNDRKVLSAHLATGDQIRLGNIEFAFDAGGDLPRPAGAARSGGWQQLWQRIRGWFG